MIELNKNELKNDPINKIPSNIPNEKNPDSYQSHPYKNNAMKPEMVRFFDHPNLRKSSQSDIQNLSLTELEQILLNSKYFVIKSVNQENIMIARQYSEWATTVTNQVITI